MGEVVALANGRGQVSADDVQVQPIEMETPAPRRVAAAMAASIALHLLALTALLSLRPPPPLATPIVVFPVSLVSVGGPGGGEGGGTPDAIPSPPPPPAPPEPVAEVAPPTPVPTPVVHPKVTKPAKPPRSDTPPSAVANVPSVEAAGGVPAPSGGETGAGGGGGAGFSAASPAYGVNPQPPYPMVARRLKLEGTVVLRVFVAPDGTPKRVEVLQSSGHDSLDTSAADTVRERWRFQPARRNGIPIEDSVQVPIRFHQSAG